MMRALKMRQQPKPRISEAMMRRTVMIENKCNYINAIVCVAKTEADARAFVRGANFVISDSSDSWSEDRVWTVWDFVSDLFAHHEAKPWLTTEQQKAIAS